MVYKILPLLFIQLSLTWAADKSPWTAEDQQWLEEHSEEFHSSNFDIYQSSTQSLATGKHSATPCDEAPSSPSKRVKQSAETTPESTTESRLTLEIERKDVSIWRHNLDYEYNDQYFSTLPWHIQTARMLNSLAKVQEGVNFARVRCEALLRGTDGIIRVLFYEFPFIFTSRSGIGPILPSQDCKSLAEIFPEEQDDKLCSRIKKLGQFSQSLTTPNVKQEFFHTENSIFLYIMKDTAWLKKIQENQQSGDELVHLVFLLCTYYDPCTNCVLSISHSLQLNQYFQKRIAKRIKQCTISTSSHWEIFVEVSSLKEYRESRQSLRRNYDAIVANPIQLTNTGVFFAQMVLNIADEETLHTSSYIPALKIKTEETPAEERTKLEQAIQNEDYRLEADLLFKIILNNKDPKLTLYSKQRVEAVESNLLTLIDPHLSQEQVQSHHKSFIERYEQKKKEHSKEILLDEPTPILKFLMEFFCNRMRRNPEHKRVKDHFEKDFELVCQQQSKTIGKEGRDKILQLYLNNTTYAELGQKHDTSLADVSWLLKIFGFLYLRDSVPEKYVPTELKEYKRKCAKKAESKAKENSLLDILNKVADNNTSSEHKIIQQIAISFREKISNGRFLRENDKYYFVEDRDRAL